VVLLRWGRGDGVVEGLRVRDAGGLGSEREGREEQNGGKQRALGRHDESSQERCCAID